ncbi:unnamed protein product [Zymoseptoria tritici ST99CH_1A5]|uniref:Uncharacterized protein n=1 Tax=Zymoseptoria tritici ST99CH_1A5 TaxID=1276529 RepID=A0A1Y6LGH3_ZYMTR|nr:unnamed protein product [Zymoseptoria tritici ST99CH_1A5]
MNDEDAPGTGTSTPLDSTQMSQSASKAAPVKDRQCPFCNQSFTSSSLGRHLDLYIRPKNPKPADGVHDVEEIRKLRGGITRRQVKSGTKGGNGSEQRGSRESFSATPSGGLRGMARGDRAETRRREPTPTPSPTPSIAEDEEKAVSEPSTGRACITNKAAWQATGVINDLPPRAMENGPPRPPLVPRWVNGVAAAAATAAATGSGQTQRISEMRQDAGGNRIQRPEYESESMLKLQEAAELGRAAEMALREVLGNLEAAKKAVKPKNLYDDFDFYSLSFPGLCLAILPPPGTLFTPTPFPSAESWTLEPPGQRQYDTMNRFLNLRITERQASDNISDSIAFKHHAHLSGAWEHWQTLVPSERSSAWTLEVLRSYNRSQESLKAQRLELEKSQQRINHLEAEFDRLSRCQLPREYLMRPPTSTFVPANVMREVDKTTAASTSEVTEANYDAETLISKWRQTIRAIPRTSSRNSASQRPTSPASAPPTAAGAPSVPREANPKGSSITGDIIMQGAVLGVGGPIPRHRGGWNEYQPRDEDTPSNSVSYETPPEPGVVMSAEDSLASPQDDEDANGEVEEGYEHQNGSGTGSGENSAVARRRNGEGGKFASPRSGLGGNLNGNGKRAGDVLRDDRYGQTRLYKGQVPARD